MAKAIHELKAQKFEKVREAREILDKADREKRALNAVERATYDKLSAEIDLLDKDIIDAEADLERRRKLADAEIRGRNGSRDVDPAREFRSIGEFFHAVAVRSEGGPHDPRLDRAYEEARAQSMGVGAEGGFALPTQFRDTILQVSPQEAIVRPRATVIPAGDPPDARLDMPAVDQTSAKNMYGGVVITHTGEGITMTETDAALRQVSMEPKEMSAYIVTTNKLLNNWDAASTFLTTQLRRAMLGQEDYDCLRGDGINKALGILNAPCTITVARAGANAISFADLYTMYARLKMGGSPVWIVSPTCIPQLCQLVDAGNHALWIGGDIQGGAAAVPGRLLGLPVVFSERSPALGQSGDILLADLSYYLIKDGSGPFAGISTELLFLSNRTVFRLVWNVDGRPWLTEPISLEGSTANTISPFVKLS